MYSALINVSSEKPKQKLGLFLFVLGLTVLTMSNCLWSGAMLFAEAVTDVKVIEELDHEEREREIERLLVLGERYEEMKQYDLAGDAYETIFLLDADHNEASQRLDRLKKTMLKEGKAEREIVGGMYEAEIDSRRNVYWSELEKLVSHKRWSQARFTLEKILLLDPLNQEATKMHMELKQAALEGREPNERLFNASQ